MDSLQGLIQLGRAFRTMAGSSRGALIDLHGTTAYLVNSKRSLVLRLRLGAPLADGHCVFYAGEAPMTTQSIRSRDEQVLFEWKTRDTTKRIYVPQKDCVEAPCTQALALGVKPTIAIPASVLQEVSGEILTLAIAVEGDTLVLEQKRSDGTVNVVTEKRLGTGLVPADHGARRSVTVFSADLANLAPFVTELQIGIQEKAPLRLEGTMTFGDSFDGVIGQVVYE